MRDKLEGFEKRQIIKNVVAGAILIVLFFSLNNLSQIISLVKKSINILSPFLLGYGLSFLLRPLKTSLEKVLPFKAKVNHTMAVMLSVIVALFGVVLILLFIIPDLVSSIVSISEQLPSLFKQLQAFYEQLKFDESWATQIKTILDSAQSFLVNSLQASVTEFISGATQVTSMVVNFFMTLIIAIYISLDEEFFRRNANKLSLAILGQKPTQHLVEFTHISSAVFKQFFYSKGASSLLLGVTSWIILTLVGVHYSLLLATIFGLFNMIPIFGFVISIVLISIFMVLVNLNQVIIVLVILIILKLIENTFITKNLFGQPVKLPVFWILVAMVIGSYAYGFIGLFLSVPLFTIGYLSFDKWVEKRNQTKGGELL